MRDPQRERVYKWEAEFHDWNIGSLTLAECRAAIRWACEQYGITSPRVEQHRDKEYSYSKGDLISLRLDQKNAAVSLHEAAHYICDQIFGSTVAPHSPQWMGIYLWLLEGYRVAPRVALHASAKARRIKWVQTWLVSPKRLGRRR